MEQGGVYYFEVIHPRVKKVSATVVTKRAFDPFAMLSNAACKRLEMATDERLSAYTNSLTWNGYLVRAHRSFEEQLNPRKQNPEPTPNTVPKQPQAVVQNAEMLWRSRATQDQAPNPCICR